MASDTKNLQFTGTPATSKLTVTAPMTGIFVPLAAYNLILVGVKGVVGTNRRGNMDRSQPVSNKQVLLRPATVIFR